VHRSIDLNRAGAIRALLAVATASLLLAALAPARASALSAVVCSGSESVTITPGLTLRTQTSTVAFTDTFGTPVSCISTDPTLRSGTASASFDTPVNCLDPLLAVDGELLIRWNNGQTSSFVFRTTITTVAGVSVSTNTGTIVAGEFSGHVAEHVIPDIPPSPLGCLTPSGVTSLSGPFTFTVV
jgi:hypothetical protein